MGFHVMLGWFPDKERLEVGEYLLVCQKNSTCQNRVFTIVDLPKL